MPESLHRKYKGSKKINIIKGPDMNVGIRRAKGEFVFATNSDILFSNELIEFLASGKIDPSFFYRANRFDVNRKVMELDSPEEVMDFCRKNIIAEYRKDNTSHHGLSSFPNLHINAGDFVMFSKDYWDKIHGWPEINHIGLYSDGLLCYMVYLSGLKEKVFDDLLCVYHIDHDSRWRKLVTSKTKLINFLKEKFYTKSKSVFLKSFIRKIRHLIDKAAVFLSDKIGDNKDKDFEIRRLRLNYEETLLDMLTHKRSYIYNDDTWGNPNENLEEFIIESKNN